MSIAQCTAWGPALWWGGPCFEGTRRWLLYHRHHHHQDKKKITIIPALGAWGKEDHDFETALAIDLVLGQPVLYSMILFTSMHASPPPKKIKIKEGRNTPHPTPTLWLPPRKCFVANLYLHFLVRPPSEVSSPISECPGCVPFFLP